MEVTELFEATKYAGGGMQPAGFPPLPEDWESQWTTFQADLVSIFMVTHHKKKWNTPRVLLVIHGLGEHGGRYLHFPHYLKNVVDAVACMDLRGHGRSEGVRGHVDDFNLYVDDVAKAISLLDEELKRRFGGSEIHVLGHSMGGLVLLRLLLKKGNLPIKSAAVSAPLLGIRSSVNAVKKSAVTLLSKMWGTFHLTSGLNSAKISHDPAVVKAYDTDRLVHKKVTPKFFVSLQAAILDTVQRTAGIKPPLLFLVPLADEIVGPDKTITFFNELKHRNKRIKMYKDFFHESFNEVGKEQAFHDLEEWIGMWRDGG
ncbi:MAG: alpha/beta fold hydrolase [Bdellovibrionota bacterium]